MKSKGAPHQLDITPRARARAFPKPKPKEDIKSSYAEDDLSADADDASVVSDAKRHPRALVKEALDAYNKLAIKAGLPVCEKLIQTSATYKSLVARLREGGMDLWQTVLAEIESSEFVRGRNNTGFRVSLPWAVKPDNFQKIIGGQYRNNRNLSSQPDGQRAAPKPAVKPEKSDLFGDLS
jgi:hypothetical protein